MSSVVSETQTRQPSQNAWDGGDVGYVWGQCDPKKKGVMSTQGNISKTAPYRAAAILRTDGRELATIKSFTIVRASASFMLVSLVR